MPTRIPTDSEPSFSLPQRLLAPRDAFTAVGRNLLLLVEQIEQKLVVDVASAPS